jgi:uncharacterized protein YdiU (UPF0061 family)
VAQWQVYGFANGVLNTDNTSIAGLSLDFGPFAFLDAYDPAYTPNHDDHALRYAYRAQPSVVWWNLVRLAEGLAELLGAGARIDHASLIASGPGEADVPEMQERVQALVEAAGHEYRAVFALRYRAGMAARLGLRMDHGDARTNAHADADTDALVTSWLAALEPAELDFHLSFRRLSRVRVADLSDAAACKEAAGVFLRRDGSEPIGGFEEAQARLADWLARWKERVVKDWGAEADGERIRAMQMVNPKVRVLPFVGSSVAEAEFLIVCAAELDPGGSH